MATTAIACFACWALALLLVHALRPDRPLATTFISGYAVGPYGWVMTTGWLAASCGCLMLALGLARSGPQSAAARVGRLLLVILASLLVFTFALQFLTAYFQVFYGLVNRFFVTVIIVWLLATSIRLRAVERGSAAGTPNSVGRLTP